MISAEEAIERLKKGNEQYVAIDTFHTDVSPTTLEHFAKNGQSTVSKTEQWCLECDPRGRG